VNLFLFRSWLLVVFFSILGTPLYAACTSDLAELQGWLEDSENQAEIMVNGTTPTVKAVQAVSDIKSQYVENSWLQDFEVHFLVSLPFTALYSYVSVLSLDAMVQGKFPPEFHQADMWMIIGAAVGSSLAIALGSINRVPDQTNYQLQSQLDLDEAQKKKRQTLLSPKIELVKIIY